MAMPWTSSTGGRRDGARGRRRPSASVQPSRGARVDDLVLAGRGGEAPLPEGVVEDGEDPEGRERGHGEERERGE